MDLRYYSHVVQRILRAIKKSIEFIDPLDIIIITYWLDNKDFLGRVLPTNPNWDPKYELTGDSMCNITDVNKVITYWLDNKDFLGRIVCPGPGF